VRELKGFQKVELTPGASRKLTFTLRPKDLAFVGVDLRWVTEPGRFRVAVGGLGEEFTHQ
jgi:beta-glucosidase